MIKLALLYKDTFGIDVSNMPGSGAAGIITYYYYFIIFLKRLLNNKNRRITGRISGSVRGKNKKGTIYLNNDNY